MTPKRPRDPNQLAKSIIDIATGQKPDRDPTPGNRQFSSKLSPQLANSTAVFNTLSRNRVDSVLVFKHKGQYEQAGPKDPRPNPAPPLRGPVDPRHYPPDRAQQEHGWVTSSPN